MASVSYPIQGSDTNVTAVTTPSLAKKIVFTGYQAKIVRFMTGRLGGILRR